MHKHFFSRVLLAVVVLVLAAGCTRVPRATILYFSEQEIGGNPYVTRMLVTKDYLRIDDGHAADNFILLDRQAKVIYSVNYADNTILEIRQTEINLRPPELRHAVERDKETYPSVDGKPVQRYMLLTNDKSCSEVFAAEGLLPEAVKALREYHRVLAGDQALVTARRPKELQTDCVLAEDVFVPVRHLDFGFPVRHKTYTGKTRDLTDFKADVEIEAKLFDLPAGHRVYSIQDRSS